MAKKCNYPFIANYLSENTALADEAREHGQDCMHCLEKAIRLELVINQNRKDNLLNLAGQETLPNETIFEMAESYVTLKSQKEGYEILKEEKWQTLWQNAADFAIFKEILYSLESNITEYERTPEYLQNIVRGRLKTTQTSKEKSGMVIRLKEGLQLLGSYLDNVFELPNANEAFAVRSSAAAVLDSPAASLLQFFTKEENDQRILYQVVQDGENTVMLTVKLQDFKPLPRLMKIIKDDRLIYSFQLKEDFAYFPKLVAGDYVIELKNKSSQTVKSIDISIVAD